MARVKIELPAKFEFSIEVRVRISDINYGGHLGNDSVLSFIHEARLRFLNSYGFTELNINGFGLIMTDSVIVYKNQGLYGQILLIEVSVGDISKSGFDFIYRIREKESGKDVALAKTGMAFFNYQKNKVVRVPEKFKAIFTKP
jgi:acyl-CoA thioesterase FadM